MKLAPRVFFRATPASPRDARSRATAYAVVAATMLGIFACGAPESGAQGAGTAGGVSEAGGTCPGVSLVTDGNLDLDIPRPGDGIPSQQSIAIQCAVTLNGGLLPASGSRGSVRFRGLTDGSTDDLSFDLDLAPSGDFSVELNPGHYSVMYSASTSSSRAPSMPWNSGFVIDELAATEEGFVVIPIRSVAVSGNHIANGQPLQTPESGGGVKFSRDGGGAFAEVSGGSYFVRLLPGPYDVAYVAPAQTCDGRSYSAIPCASAPIQSNVQLVQDGVYDINLRLVVVNGRVTAGGNPLSQVSGELYPIVFSHRDLDAPGAKFTPSPTQDTYALTLIAGNYLVSYDGIEQACDLSSGQTVCAAAALAGCNP